MAKKRNKWDGCSLDRSFCATDCSNMDCYRNSKYITDTYPHSFCEFKGSDECEGYAERKSRKKKAEPNYDSLLKSAISCYQSDYSEYKREQLKLINMTFISEEGLFSMSSEYNNQLGKVEGLSKMVAKDAKRVKELKDLIEKHSEVQ